MKNTGVNPIAAFLSCLCIISFNACATFASDDGANAKDKKYYEFAYQGSDETKRLEWIGTQLEHEKKEDGTPDKIIVREDCKMADIKKALEIKAKAIVLYTWKSKEQGWKYEGWLIVNRSSYSDEETVSECIQNHSSEEHPITEFLADELKGKEVITPAGKVTLTEPKKNDEEPTKDDNNDNNLNPPDKPNDPKPLDGKPDTPKPDDPKPLDNKPNADVPKPPSGAGYGIKIVFLLGSALVIVGLYLFAQKKRSKSQSQRKATKA